MRFFRNFLWVWSCLIAAVFALTILAESTSYFGGVIAFLLVTPLTFGSAAAYIHWVITKKVQL